MDGLLRRFAPLRKRFAFVAGNDGILNYQRTSIMASIHKDIIIALIPLALKGVAYRAVGAGALLRRNLLIYGLGGIIVPFIGIKAIDLVVAALHLA